MNTLSPDSIQYEPVPYENMVDSVRPLFDGDGLPILVAALDGGDFLAVADIVVSAIVADCVGNGFVRLSKAGRKEARRRGKKKGVSAEWEEELITREACGTFEKRMAVMLDILAASGLGGFPPQAVISAVVLSTRG